MNLTVNNSSPTAIRMQYDLVHACARSIPVAMTSLTPSNLSVYTLYSSMNTHCPSINTQYPSINTQYSSSLSQGCSRSILLGVSD